MTLNKYYRTGTLNAIMIAITDYCYLQPGKPLLRVLCKLSLADAFKLELILSYLFCKLLAVTVIVNNVSIK